MSTVNGQVFPNTTFPNSVQELPTFTNLSDSDEANYIGYIKAVLDNDFATASLYLNNINDEAKISANELNTISDTVGALQAVYEDEEKFIDIVDAFQKSWGNIINRFSYVGTWTTITAYDNTAIYSTAGVLVNYGSKTWRRNSTAGYTAGQIPQDGSAFWEQYYYKNTMVTYNNMLYIALQDVNTLNDPATDNGTYWKRITVVGAQGDAGTSFNYMGEYSSSTPYSAGQLIIYNNKCYSSLQNSNTGHTPSTSTTWWKEEFVFTMQQIPVTSTQPTDQVEGDIWFDLITLS